MDPTGVRGTEEQGRVDIQREVKDTLRCGRRE